MFLLGCFLALRWYIRDSYRVGGFTQKHVFITGCDSGFGNLLARQLDRKGFKVIAGCLTEKGASDLAAVTSPRLKTLLLDVTDSASIRSAAEFVSREVGQQGELGSSQRELYRHKKLFEQAMDESRHKPLPFHMIKPPA